MGSRSTSRILLFGATLPRGQVPMFAYCARPRLKPICLLVLFQGRISGAPELPSMMRNHCPVTTASRSGCAGPGCPLAQHHSSPLPFVPYVSFSLSILVILSCPAVLYPLGACFSHLLGQPLALLSRAKQRNISKPAAIRAYSSRHPKYNFGYSVHRVVT